MTPETHHPGTIGLCFFMKDAYPLFNPAADGIFGGAEVDLYLLATAFARDSRYRVTFLVGDFGQPDVEQRQGVRLVKLRYSNLERYRRWHHKVIRRLLIIRALMRDSSDIVMTKTASDTLGLMVLVKKLFQKKHVVYKLGSDMDADLAFWRKRSLVLYLLYTFSLRFIDTIICQTRQQQQLVTAKLRRSSIVIKNGFPIPPAPPDSPREHILWVARYDFMKRPRLYVRMAQALPNEHFIMIMPGGAAQAGALMREIRALPNLSFVESVPFTEIQHYFDRARCFVNTSEFEGFCNTFIQACLGGAPILSFSVNPDDFINRFELGCFCRGSFDRAVDFIRSLDAAAERRYGANGLRYVREHHNLTDKLQQYSAAFSRLLSPRAGTHSS